VNCNQSSYGVGLNVSAKPSTAYVFSFKDETQGEAGVVFFGADGKRISAVYFNQPQNWAFTTPADCENMMLVFYPSTTNADKTYELPQLELGSTAHDYEPYSGMTLTIDLDGTIYGGTLDVLTGVLTVTRKGVYLGDLSWVAQTTGGSNKRVISNDLKNEIKKPPSSSVAAEIICTEYATLTADQVYTENTGISINSQGTISAYDPDYQSGTAFKNATGDVLLVYPLAESQTVQLDPAQLSTLAGENNVWADTGDTTMTYMAQEA
jgi:hypothetical protein